MKKNKKNSILKKMTDLLTELDTISENNFRFQNQKVLLTYRTHISKEVIEMVMNMVSKGKLKACYIAHENGTSDPVTPYEHTHVVADFGRVIQSKNSRFLDVLNIHPHRS